MSDQKFDAQKHYAAQVWAQQQAYQNQLVRDFWGYFDLSPVDRVWKSREAAMEERNRERLESYRVKRRVLGV